jgi:primosomal replication protein N
MNRLDITGQVLELSPVRYTPAGIAVSEFLINSESEEVEAGQSRKVALQISVIAMGDLVQMASRLQLGTNIQIRGFLAPMRKDSPRFRLHAQLIKQI